MEEWRPVKGYENLYEVSNFGQVRSVDREVVQSCTQWGKPMTRKIKGTTLVQIDNKNGYLKVALLSQGKRKSCFVHRLVAEAFVDNHYNKPCINHIDYDRHNNKASNLEWCTHRENTLYSVDRMRHPKKTILTNTGERYISWVKGKRRFRLTIQRRQYGIFKTLSEAVARREEVLNGEINNL